MWTGTGVFMDIVLNGKTLLLLKRIFLKRGLRTITVIISLPPYSLLVLTLPFRFTSRQLLLDLHLYPPHTLSLLSLSLSPFFLSSSLSLPFSRYIVAHHHRFIFLSFQEEQ